MDLTADELAFLRFCAEEPRPVRFDFIQRQAGSPATLQAVKLVGGKQETCEIGPVGMKKLIPLFEKNMTLTPAAQLFLQANENA